MDSTTALADLHSRRSPEATRLRRVLAIMLDLDREGYTADELASRHGVSVRQIKADIRLLRAAGLHVGRNPYRVRLPRDTQTPGP